jgi:hypothetical protein
MTALRTIMKKCQKLVDEHQANKGKELKEHQQREQYLSRLKASIQRKKSCTLTEVHNKKQNPIHKIAQRPNVVEYNRREEVDIMDLF